MRFPDLSEGRHNSFAGQIPAIGRIKGTATSMTRVLPMLATAVFSCASLSQRYAASPPQLPRNRVTRPSPGSTGWDIIQNLSESGPIARGGETGSPHTMRRRYQLKFPGGNLHIEPRADRVHEERFMSVVRIPSTLALVKRV
jgi:hypothetical protein